MYPGVKRILISVMVILLIGIGMNSCTMNIQKRRYRPGYYVDFHTENQTRYPSNQPFREQVNHVQFVDSNSIKVVEKNEAGILLNNPATVGGDNPVKSKVSVQHVHENNLRQKNLFNGDRIYKKPIPIDQTKIRNRRTVRILGIISIAFAVAAIILAIIGAIGGGWGGLAFLFVAAILGGIAVLGGLTALIVSLALKTWLTKDEKEELRYLKQIKKNNQDNYNDSNSGNNNRSNQKNNTSKVKSEKYFKATFIYSLITLSIALVGMVFSFFIFPLGLMGSILSIISVVSSIIGIGLGGRGLKDSYQTKVILTFVFAAIALLLAMVGLVITFI